jgi:hypothetical protein
MAAHAQSSMGLTTTPSTFTSGTTIAIEASVTTGASPEYWCFAWENSHIIGVVPYPHVCTVQCASEGGANHLDQLWLVIHPSGSLANSCVSGYYAAANTVVLWHIRGGGARGELWHAGERRTALEQPMRRVAERDE